MNARTVIYLIAAVIAAAIVLVNWGALAMPVDLQLFIISMRVPVIVLLLVTIAVAVLVNSLAQAIGRRDWQTRQRALEAQLHEARVQLSSADASRLGALQAALERDTAALNAQLEKLLAGQAVLLDQVPEMRELDAHGNRRFEV